MEIGLFFGSFNPVHVGHMIIANHMVENSSMDKLWMVVSPQNPFKKKSTLAKDYDRLHLVQLAIGDHPKIAASNIEFDMPQPSYTIDTLTYLQEKYPSKSFALIMGQDNLASFHKWKNYEQILAHHNIYVYRRGAPQDIPLADHPRITMVDAPLLHISSSYIRAAIKNGKSVQYMLTEPVYNYLQVHPIYENLG